MHKFSSSLTSQHTQYAVERMFTDRVSREAKAIDSFRPSVCLSVCFHSIIFVYSVLEAT